MNCSRPHALCGSAFLARCGPPGGKTGVAAALLEYSIRIRSSDRAE
ncbi:MAG: hypothetical protein MJE77_44650 [Proteobacteria bacterium]|nr:hypothetical protein [Pseudomonadota bacterium]